MYSTKQVNDVCQGLISIYPSCGVTLIDNVNLMLNKITHFTCGQDGAENNTPVDLSIITKASRKAAITVLQPGDNVKVFEGEQSGVQGTVQSIKQDIVTIMPVGVNFDRQKVQIPARSICKHFKPRDHIKVMTGMNSDKTSLVVSVSNNIVTFLLDMSLQEVCDTIKKDNLHLLSGIAVGILQGPSWGCRG